MNEVKFNKSDVNEMKGAAAFIGQLTKDCIAFHIEYDEYYIFVKLTGGY